MRHTAPVLVALLAWAAPSAANIAFVEASSELDEGRPATYGYNLVDGKDTSAWCSQEQPNNEAVMIGFDRRVKITKVGVIVGALKGGKIDQDAIADVASLNVTLLTEMDNAVDLYEAK